MSEAMSLDRFDKVNAFRIALNGNDTDADQEELREALDDRDEWECRIDGDIIRVKGAGTEDGLRNLLQALTDVDPDILTIHDDDEADADETADADDSADDDGDEADEDDNADTTGDEAEEPEADTEMDEAAEDAEEETEDADDTADADDEQGDENDTDAETDDNTGDSDEPDAAAEAVDDELPDAAAAGSMVELFTAYMEQHSAAVDEADTTLDALDLDIADPDDLLELLQLPEQTAYIAEATGYDEDAVTELLNDDLAELETELDEVSAAIEQLETLKETSGDRLSSLQPDDIDDELEQLQDEQDDVEERLERLDAVTDAAAEHDAKAEQADRLEEALQDAADAIDNQLELAVVEQEDTHELLLPGTDESPGALAAIIRSRVTTVLDDTLGTDTYTVTAGNPLTVITVGADNVDHEQIAETVEDSTDSLVPVDLTHQIHTYSTHTV